MARYLGHGHAFSSARGLRLGDDAITGYPEHYPHTIVLGPDRPPSASFVCGAPQATAHASDVRRLAGRLHSPPYLAELYERRSARAPAARYYLRFAELWKEADPALQPRVALARRRAAALGSRP